MYVCKITRHSYQVRCGTENFENATKLMDALIALDPHTFVGYKEFLVPLLEKYKEHCKSGLPKHLNRTSKVAVHCAHHLFGGQKHFSKECGAECEGHPDRCKECDAGRVFIHVLRFVPLLFI